MDAYLISWFEEIKKATAATTKVTSETAAVDRLNKSRELARRTRPLTEQITELMQSLPPALRDRHWLMTDLVARLAGRYRDRPSAKNVGSALRVLGWRRVRLYSKGFDGARVWLPGGF